MSEKFYSMGWHQSCENLYAIKRHKWWGHAYADFEDYAKRRWGLSKTRAKLFCNFAIFCGMCREDKQTLPEAPDQVAALLKLPQKSWRDAWRYCVDCREGDITPSHIEATLERFGFVANKRQPQIVRDRMAAKTAGRALNRIQDPDSVTKPGTEWKDQKTVHAAISLSENAQ